MEATTNGNGQTTPPKPIREQITDLRQQQALVRNKIRLAHLKRSERLLESWGYYYDSFNFGDDARTRLWRQQNEAGWVPINNLSDRKHGQNYPLFQNETELNMLRAPARLLCATNPYAVGLLSGLTSYTINSGYNYRATSKEDGADDLDAMA